LLGADVLIAENLRGLDALAGGRPYTFVAAPLAPAGVFAWEPGRDGGRNDPNLDAQTDLG